MQIACPSCGGRRIASGSHHGRGAGLSAETHRDLAASCDSSRDAPFGTCPLNLWTLSVEFGPCVVRCGLSGVRLLARSSARFLQRPASLESVFLENSSEGARERDAEIERERERESGDSLRSGDARASRGRVVKKARTTIARTRDPRDPPKDTVSTTSGRDVKI